jgi:prephenate dehydratase
MPKNRSFDEPPSREHQSTLAAPRVAYQGIAGAFGEEAVQQIWRGRARPSPVRTFAGVLEALACRDVDWAVIPIWNSTIGRIATACAALERHEDMIDRVRELALPVRHALLAHPGTTITDLHYVGSHPAALAQCTRLFQEHRTLTACEAFDTAGAAHELAAFGDPARQAEGSWYRRLRVDSPARLGVIASASAAIRYGLVVLRDEVQDDPANVTRFVVVRAREVAS